MIRSFGFRNVWSFADEQSLSFEVGKGLSGDPRFVETARGDHLGTVLAVIGHNASGKTNILKALSFFTWFILRSWDTLDAKEKIPLNTFAFSDRNEESSFFYVTVETLPGHRYYYELELSESRVLSEELRRMDHDKNTWKYIFKRKNHPEDKSLSVRNIGMKKRDIALSIRENASTVSVFKKFENSGIEDFIAELRMFSDNVGPAGRNSDEDGGISFAAVKKIGEDNEYKKTISNIVRRFDVGIAELDAKKLSEDDIQKLLQHVKSMPNPGDLDTVLRDKDLVNELYELMAIHKVDGKVYPFSFLRESDGTRQLLGILTRVLAALESGGLMLHDELETGLHPHVLPEILKLFFSKRTNPKNAQIIFTTHCTDIMRELHKSQIVLVQKDERCRSQAWRLDDMKGVRLDDNILAKYHSGAYGAVPSF